MPTRSLNVGQLGGSHNWGGGKMVVIYLDSFINA